MQPAHAAHEPTSAGKTIDLLLLCAFHLWRSRKPRSRHRVVIVTDDSERYSERACRSVLGQWSEWVVIDSYWDIERSAAGATATPPAICLALVTDSHALAVVRERCSQAGIALIEPKLPLQIGLEDHFFLELFLFDVEPGDERIWDPAAALRRLSTAQCRAAYPTEELTSMPCDKHPWRALDVGCGPISALRWGALQGHVTLTGLDPLIEMHALVRARHGYEVLPEIRCSVEIPGIAEQLDELVPDCSFDLIFTQNALDHTREPERVVRNFARTLAPEGRVIIQLATREGTRQGWDQFHKTDIDLRDGALVYRHQHTEGRPLLAPDCGLRLHTVQRYSPERLSVVLRSS